MVGLVRSGLVLPRVSGRRDRLPSVPRLWRCHRQAHRERGTLARRTLTPDLTPDRIEEFLGDRQPVARGGFPTGGLRGETHATLEQVRLLSGAQAWPRILHAARHAGRLGLEGDG